MGILTCEKCTKRGNNLDPTTISLSRIKDITRSCGLDVRGLNKKQICEKLFK